MENQAQLKLGDSSDAKTLESYVCETGLYNTENDHSGSRLSFMATIKG